MSVYWPLFLFASNEKGNGGDAIVCRDDSNQILRAELLDFYEGENLNYIDLYYGEELPVETHFTNMINRLKPYMPKLAYKLQETGEYILSGRNTKFMYDITLEDIEDSFHIFVPNDCQLEQVAIQRDPLFPGNFKFIINADIWDHLDSYNKAGLVFHEALYFEQRDHITNSVWVRYLTGLVSDRKNSNELDDISILLKVAKELGAERYIKL